MHDAVYLPIGEIDFYFHLVSQFDTPTKKFCRCCAQFCATLLIMNYLCTNRKYSNIYNVVLMVMKANNKHVGNVYQCIYDILWLLLLQLLFVLFMNCKATLCINKALFSPLVTYLPVLHCETHLGFDNMQLLHKYMNRDLPIHWRLHPTICVGISYK